MRIEMGPVVQHVNKKWSVSFNMFVGTPGNELMSAGITSMPLWDTEDTAYAAGERGLDLIEDTGKFPNMCEVW